jgi:hypothetical protein
MLGGRALKSWRGSPTLRGARELGFMPPGQHDHVHDHVTTIGSSRAALGLDLVAQHPGREALALQGAGTLV